MPALRHALPALCLLLPLRLAAAPPSADRASAFTVNAPIINFRIPTFTRDGNRAWLLCGGEGRYLSANELEVKNLSLTVFAGDSASTVESVFLSPAATADLDESLVR